MTGSTAEVAEVIGEELRTQSLEVDVRPVGEVHSLEGYDGVVVGGPILRATRPFKPASIGVFGGRMEFGRLKWWAVIFAMVIVQAQAGDRRDWTAIRLRASQIPSVFRLLTR